MSKRNNEQWVAVQRAARNAAIEECAQVAETCRERYGWEIADAIRALKDKA